MQEAYKGAAEKIEQLFQNVPSIKTNVQTNDISRLFERPFVTIIEYYGPGITYPGQKDVLGMYTD